MEVFSEMTENKQFTALALDLRSIAEERKQASAVSLIDRATGELSKGVFSLAILGMVKRGKSTFCNALLGADCEKYAPVGKVPVSNAVSVFKKGKDSVLVEFLDGHKETATFEDIPQFVTEQLNPGNRKSVRCLHITSAFPRLPDGVAIVDTPGEGSFHTHHDDILYKYLPTVDAAIFLIDVFAPLTESELDFLKEIARNDIKKIFFAINSIDMADSEEIDEAVEHNIQALADIGMNVSKIYPISAKSALDGAWEGSGMSALFSDINKFLSAEKFRIPRQRFMNRILPVIAPLEEGIRAEIEARTKTAEDLRTEIAELTAKGEALEKSQNTAFGELRKTWDSAAADFFSGMLQGLTDLKSELQAQVAQISVVNAKGAKHKFANMLDAGMGRVFNKHIDAFNERIAKALQDLPVIYGGMERADGSMGAAETLRIGTDLSAGKIATAALMGVVGFTVAPIGIGIALIGGMGMLLNGTTNRIKNDLQQDLADVIDRTKSFWESQRHMLEAEREKLIDSLSEQFRLQMSPTVQALQDALESQGKIDAQYDEKLKMLKSLIEAARERANELIKGLEARA